MRSSDSYQQELVERWNDQGRPDCAHLDIEPTGSLIPTAPGTVPSTGARTTTSAPIAAQIGDAEAQSLVLGQRRAISENAGEQSPPTEPGPHCPNTQRRHCR
jgi:hypothetical protein